MDERSMDGFRKLVAPGRKQDPREQEVVSELAAHLEEMYTDLRREGASESQAIAQVTAAGEKLGPAIRRLRWQHEGGMKTWLRAVALPGLLLSLLYAASRALILDVYWEVPFLWHEAGVVLITIALGFCAAAFSRELGGDLSRRRWAGLLVISPYAAVWCVMGLIVTPVQLLEWAPYRHSATIRGVTVSLLGVLLWDVIIPSAGLAIGGAISTRAFTHDSPHSPTREVA